MTQNEIKLLYMLRDKLVRELYELEKKDNISTSDIIKYVYNKLTIFTTEMDKRK